MKAFEVTGTIDKKGQLILDRPLTLDNPGPVGIILLPNLQMKLNTTPTILQLQN